MLCPVQRPTMGPLHKQKWDDPLSSVGDYRGTIEIKIAGVFKEKRYCWEAKDGSPASTALKQLLPKITELFQASGNRVPDSAMVLTDIFMIGETAVASVPYIMFSCPNSCKRARIEAMNLVRRSGLLRESPGVKAFHWEFPPHIPNPELTIGNHLRLAGISHDENDGTDEFSRGSSGDRAALEIFLSATYNGKVDTSTTQKSTIGAIIRSGQCVLYFTAAHILLPESVTASQGRPKEEELNDLDQYDSDFFSEDDSAYESEDDDETIESSKTGQLSPPPPGQAMIIHELEPPLHSLSRNTGTELLDTPTRSDESRAVSTPTWAPCFTNGEVFFKSHDLDFALLDLSGLELTPCDIPELSDVTVSAIKAGSTEVVARVGSRRDLRGQLSGRPTYIRFPHGSIHQEVYPVCFSSDIRMGDSGTVVRDARTGRIYGHIVVASVASRTAFIVPSTKVLEAIPWLTPTPSPIYTPLDSDSGQFRLVRLLPPRPYDDVIRCELSPACLEDRPRYEVLSYVWGEQEASRPILLNDRPWSVRPVLANALRRLRYEDADRHIWVDALCIDQIEPQDRINQIGLIKEIHGRCDRCLVWLGDVYDANSSVEWKFSLTRPSLDQPSQVSSRAAISQQDAHLAFSLITLFGSQLKDKECSRADHPGLSMTAESQKALGRLMALPWWTRFWLFQEATLSQAVMLTCGGTVNLDLDTAGENAFILRKFLRQRAWRRRSDGLDFDVLIPFLQTVGRLHRSRKHGVPTFAWNSMRDLVCWSPKVKGFALLDPLCDSEIAYGIRHSSIDNIYETITVTKLVSTKSLFPLVRTTEIGRIEKLPSWVPDWSASIGSKSQFHSELSFLMAWEIFDASAGKDSVIGIRDHTLHVEGVLIDTVLTTYSLMEPGVRVPGLILNLASQHGSASTSHPSILVGKGKTSQAAKAAPFQGGTRGLRSQELWRLLTSDIRIAEHDEMGWRRARGSDQEVCLGEYRNGLLGHGVRGRMLFSTKKRYYGLGPADMEVGDVVVVLYGGRFPFVLRPSMGKKYSLVGYAYVFGIMDGEAVSDLRETQTFEIV